MRFVLGVLAGLFALIPMFGPLLSAAPAVLVALFQPFPTVLWVLALLLCDAAVRVQRVVPASPGRPSAAIRSGRFCLLVRFQVAAVLGGLLRPGCWSPVVLLGLGLSAPWGRAQLPAQPSTSTLP